MQTEIIFLLMECTVHMVQVQGNQVSSWDTPARTGWNLETESY